MNSDKLKQIDAAGFGGGRQALTGKLSVQDFRLNYYDKKELVQFCRAQGIPSIGLKGELNQRIEIYLRTGEITKVNLKKRTESDSKSGLHLDKPVVNYKSDPATRDFFRTHLPQFKGFSAAVQKDLKRRLEAGEHLTYRDLLDLHSEFLQKGSSRVVAHDSCQFNQFTMDYKNDPTAKIHTATEAWRLVRNSPGEKTYNRYRETIDRIQKDL